MQIDETKARQPRRGDAARAVLCLAVLGVYWAGVILARPLDAQSFLLGLAACGAAALCTFILFGWKS